MMHDGECCGTCKHHKFSRPDDAFICYCEKSEFYTDMTPYAFRCEDWEEKE